MADAFIYDHVRTPRGRGKPDGCAARASRRSSSRRRRCRPCATATSSTPAWSTTSCSAASSPVGEQGADIARVAVLVAGYAETVPGAAAQPLLRLGPRGRQHAGGAGHVRPVAGRRSAAASSRCRACRWAATAAPGSTDPAVAIPDLLRAAGHRRRPDRHASTASAATTSMPTPSKARGAPRRPGPRAASRSSIVPVRDVIGSRHARARRAHAARHHAARALAALKPAFAQMGEKAGFRRGGAACSYPQVERSTTSTRRQLVAASSTARPAC